MNVMRRCLVHSYEPQRIVRAAKELVARDVEIVASLKTARILRDNGVPVTNISSFTSSTTGFDERLELLHPRLQGGVLGRWNDDDEKQELERLGIKRIDLVLVELPETMQLRGVSRIDKEWMGAVALLRSASSNPYIVTTLCELDDLDKVLMAMDQKEPLEHDYRRHLSIKAMQAVASFDAALACTDGQDGRSPPTWSVFAKRITEVPISGKGFAAGLYRVSGTEDLAELRCISGPSLDMGTLTDLDLADAILSGVSVPAVTIIHHGTPCGFSVIGTEGAAASFELARSNDPRGAFGAVAGFNRELDGECARSLSEAYLQAVVAPDFTPEAKAELSMRKVTVLKAVGGTRPFPSINSTRFGLAISWSKFNQDDVSLDDMISSDIPTDHAQRMALEIAWAIATALPAVALVICDEKHMLSCVAGQTSWREALRLALVKLPAKTEGAVAASAQPIRFADEIMTLANARVRAVRCVTGSPRQSEVLSKAQQLGVSLELVKPQELY